MLHVKQCCLHDHQLCPTSICIAPQEDKNTTDNLSCNLTYQLEKTESRTVCLTALLTSSMVQMMFYNLHTLYFLGAS